MSQMVKHAATDELKVLFDSLLALESLSELQTDMLCSIVDELTERGEIPELPDTEVNESYQRLLRRMEKESAKGEAEEDPMGIMQALLRYGTPEELANLLRALYESDATGLEQADLLFDIADELTDRGEPVPFTEEALRARYAEILRGCELAACENRQGIEPEAKPYAKPRRGFLRPALIAASIAAGLIVSNLAAYAVGYDPLGSVARWSKDAVYFIFGTSPEEDGEKETSSIEYIDLQITLSSLGIHIDLPSYIPDGFMFDCIEPDEPDEYVPIFAWFIKSNDTFSIRVKRLEAAVSFSEVNEEEQSEVYKGNFLIVSNNNRIKALWYQGLYEIVIQGDLTYDELAKMLDSI